MRADILVQMANFDSAKGDRIDPVARVCRSLFLRTELCPCRYPNAAARFPDGCVQCQNERNLIEQAWDASVDRKADSK